jgi:hypothetical protein
MAQGAEANAGTATRRAGPRAANAVDFWRGLALITIFINHIPGIYYSRFTHANFSISDSADLFVFLAGWSLRIIVGLGDRHTPTRHVVLRVCGRALTLYAAQVMITMVAIAMLAAAGLALRNPLILEWHNAAAVFQDPVPTHIGLALITHQLGYFDILPLYVALMLMAPAIVVIDRFAPNLVLPISLALYFVVLAVPLPVPTWPVEGQWFFNPLAWQLVFVLGFVAAKPDAGIGAFVRRNINWVRLVALPIAILGFLIVLFNWWPDPTKMPQPRLFFIAEKTYITPMRLIQFLSIVAVFSLVYPTIRRYAAPLTEFLSMLGRNSLEVFCMGSLLSLSGQIVRFVTKGNIAIDTVVVILGIAIMALTAWLAEWRERARSQASAKS